MKTICKQYNNERCPILTVSTKKCCSPHRLALRAKLPPYAPIFKCSFEISFMDSRVTTGKNKQNKQKTKQNKNKNKKQKQFIEKSDLIHLLTKLLKKLFLTPTHTKSWTD